MFGLMPRPATSGAGFAIKALSTETWEAYAATVERHNGIFGGCSCTWFHRPGDAPGVMAKSSLKQVCGAG